MSKHIQAYTTPAADLLFVGVPEGTKYFSVEHHEGVETKFANTLEYGEARNRGELLFIPPGYSLLSAGTADGVSDEEAGKVAGKYCKMYRDYESKYNGLAAHSLNAVQSLLSLLRSLNLNPSETVVLFKIKN